MQRKVDAMERRAEQLPRSRGAEARSRAWRRSANSVKAELVRYEAPGTALIPIRHVRRKTG